jgi:hypothetical protein
VSFEDFIQKSMKGLLGLGFKDFWAYYPTTLLKIIKAQDAFSFRDAPNARVVEVHLWGHGITTQWSGRYKVFALRFGHICRRSL